MSYSGGAETFRSCGYEVVDLHLPDEPPLLPAIVQESRIIRGLQPQLVISHEELAALPASQIFDVPCLFVTDFFQDPNPFLMGAMQCAREIIFIAERGIFTEPPFMGDVIRYVGPAIRRFDYGRPDRARARRELDLPPDAAVVLCQPGGYEEARAPMADLLVAAWDALPASFQASDMARMEGLRLASCPFRRPPGYPRVEGRLGHRPSHGGQRSGRSQKGTAPRVCEAASLGIPSISISAGVNWPDDVAIAHVRSNSAFRAGGLNAGALAQLMAEKIAGGWTPEGELPRWDGLTGAVRAIAAHVETHSGRGRIERGQFQLRS